MAKRQDLEPLPGSALSGLDLEHIPDADLLAELHRGLTLVADHFARLGAIWAELERRGRDLSDLKKGLARWLPRIAHRQLAAEAVVAFAGRPSLLHALEGVPLDRQRRLAAGEPVEVIDLANPSGTVAMPLAELPPAAVRVVFAGGEVRTPQAQRLALRPRRHSQENAGQRHFRPHYDQAAGTVRIGRMTLRLADLLAELAAAAGPELPILIHPEEWVGVRVKLSPAENERLQLAARQMGLPDWELARKALRAFGLI